MRVEEKELNTKKHFSMYNKVAQAYCTKKGETYGKPTNSLAQTRRVCRHLIAFSPEDRRKIIDNQRRVALRETIRTQCKHKGAGIICASGTKFTAKGKRVELYGILEGKKRIDDVR